MVFAIKEDGSQYVATHGKTFQHAKEAAEAGNNLKTALRWPEELCKSKPLVRKCENCFFWKEDRGVHCFTGWSGNGSRGYCKVEPKHRKTSEDNACRYFEPNDWL